MEEAGMSRWQHFKFAFNLLVELKKAEIALIVHMFAPRYCKTYAIDKIKKLATLMEKK